MSILIAFLGGMLTLLSPCTLPVIPLLFASVRGRRGQLAIMLAGMALMFGAVSWLVTVASGWVVNLTLAGRGLGAGVLRPGRAESTIATRRATANFTPGSVGESA